MSYRTTCLFCESSTLTTVLDLGLHPFADTFLHEHDMPLGEQVFPLICDLCTTCGNMQLKCATNPDERYSNHEYSYTSSNSEFSKKHWREYAEQVASKTSLGKGLVVEVGSNDGYLTEQFALRGNKALGVDPSPAMGDLARSRGISTYVELFTTKSAKKILHEHGKAELIVANNVFNHSDTPIDFVQAVAQLLDDHGTFVFELPYWYQTIVSGKFDQIYHEHVTYLSVTSSQKILSMAGLAIFAVEVVDYHGGSLRVYAKFSHHAAKCHDATTMMEQERAAGLFDPAMYIRFYHALLDNRASFLERVYDIKKKGGIIIAVGAAAKGNTLLNFYNLDHKTLSYVTDASVHKQGKYTPYTRIPIRPDSIFASFPAEQKLYALILSWNLSDQLKNALKAIHSNMEFISPWEHENDLKKY